MSGAFASSVVALTPDGLPASPHAAHRIASLGHPFGMTGAGITATLLNNLSAHDKQIGLETMCVSGGQGMVDPRPIVLKPKDRQHDSMIRVS